MPITSRLPIVSIGRSRQREVSSLRTSRPMGGQCVDGQRAFPGRSRRQPRRCWTGGRGLLPVRSRPGPQVDAAGEAIQSRAVCGPAPARPRDRRRSHTDTDFGAKEASDQDDGLRAGGADTQGWAGRGQQRGRPGGARQRAASRRTTPLAGQPPIAGGFLGGALECFRRRLRAATIPAGSALGGTRRPWPRLRWRQEVGLLPTIFGRQAQRVDQKRGTFACANSPTCCSPC